MRHCDIVSRSFHIRPFVQCDLIIKIVEMMHIGLESVQLSEDLNKKALVYICCEEFLKNPQLIVKQGNQTGQFLKGQKLVENTNIEKFKCNILSNFQTKFFRKYFMPFLNCLKITQICRQFEFQLYISLQKCAFGT